MKVISLNITELSDAYRYPDGSLDRTSDFFLRLEKLQRLYIAYQKYSFYAQKALVKLAIRNEMRELQIVLVNQAKWAPAQYYKNQNYFSEELYRVNTMNRRMMAQVQMICRSKHLVKLCQSSREDILEALLRETKLK